MRGRFFRGSFRAAAIVLGALAAFASGCSSRSFRVDAVKNPELAARGDAYAIANANPERMDTDPLVREAAGYVKTALSAKGMFEAGEGVPADVVVEVDFGAEAPKREIVRETQPVYRTVREPGYYVTESYTDAKGNTRTITRYVPGEEREEFAGWREIVFEFVTYPKYLRITAREAPIEGDDRPPRELWSVYVTNEDSEKDLEKTLPLLVAAAMDAVGQETASERTITLDDEDERVVFVKRGM